MTNCVAKNKELLKFAAKAAGGNFELDVFFTIDGEENGDHETWNPLEDNGDALMLAVKVGLDVRINHRLKEIHIYSENGFWWEKQKDDALAATRRAIVCAAAEIGKRMK